MSYLDTYGEGDERRGRILKWLLVSLAAVVVLAIVLYYTFRNFREDRQIKAFVQHLQNKDHQAAYRLWGCTDENPCRDYSFEKFMEDWGPQGQYPDASRVRVGHPQQQPGIIGSIRRFLGLGYSCRDGVIYALEYPDREHVLLYVLRADQTIGFAPWAVCAPRMQIP